MNLNIKELKKTKSSKVISSEEALKDIEPMRWSKDVLNKNKKVVVGGKNEN